jgi:hypothetical protein
MHAIFADPPRAAVGLFHPPAAPGLGVTFIGSPGEDGSKILPVQ